VTADSIRLIAFYLPQFHPIRENDEWWGKGFTEWCNVVQTRPRFSGHYQPHLPADLGYSDLRVPEVREAQADLAREYGIYGFCYYHYWFNGRRLLERPFNEVLSSGKPDFPFCLCWANENWTRVWDGGSDRILLAQHYTEEDDARHIERLIPAFRDKRYIRVNGKPLFLVYRTEALPNPARTAQMWRDAAARAGLGDLYLARIESFVSELDPKSIGFDAAVEFAPDWRNLGNPKFHWRRYFFLGRAGIIARGYIENRVFDYRSIIDLMLNKPERNYVWFRAITPSWDNSPRRTKDAVILHKSTPQRYGAWLRELVQRTIKKFDGDERIVFINAWNEWGEGNHLEPDQKWGRGYLEATYKAL
jgi:lipopolysaccharide biosynthesis protein